MKRIRVNGWGAIALICALVLSGCGSSDPATGSPSTVSAAGPTTTESSESVLATTAAPAKENFDLVPFPPLETFPCQRYGEFFPGLVGEMVPVDHVYVETGGADNPHVTLRCNWKSEPVAARYNTTPFEVEIMVQSQPDDVNVEVVRRQGEKTGSLVNSDVAQSRGGVIIGVGLLQQDRDRPHLTLQLPGLTVHVIYKCDSEFESGGVCTNAPASYTFENAVKDLEELIKAIPG
ncbi:hypothetical protein ACQE3C_13270 [Propionibacteriaceae bacterium Y1814]